MGGGGWVWCKLTHTFPLTLVKFRSNRDTGLPSGPNDGETIGTNIELNYLQIIIYLGLWIRYPTLWNNQDYNSNIVFWNVEWTTKITYNLELVSYPFHINLLTIV